MPTVREDRVFVEQGETLVAYVAAGLGITAAHVSGTKVGEFALEHRCDARDVAATGLGVAAATDDGVLLSTAGSDFEPTGFDRGAVAVTGFDGGVLAAGEDGTVAHYDGSEWTDRGAVDDGVDVRGLDADLVAATDGVHRLAADGDGLTRAGLEDAHDVAAPGVPQAATGDGLFSLGNGWLEDAAGDFRAVAADPATATPGAVGVAHAATPDACFEHADGEWTERTDLPVDEPVVDAAYAVDTTVLLTATGTLVVEDHADGDTRHRSLGLPDAAAVTVVGEEHVTGDGGDGA